MKNKKKCIPDDKLDEMVIAMYLNIIVYIPDKNRQEKLMEKVKMAEKRVRLIESIKQERDIVIVKNAIKKYSVEEIAEFLDMPVSEVQMYLEM